MKRTRSANIYWGVIILSIAIELNIGNNCNSKLHLSDEITTRFRGISRDPKDTATEKLLKFNYKKYINKPIGQLITDLKLDYRKIHFVRMRPLYLSFVAIDYSDYISLDIYTDEYVYLKRELAENESYDIWKIEDLLKEKVTKIRVRNRYGKSLKECPRKPILPVI